MCGRYTLTSGPQKLSKTFSVEIGPTLLPRYNIAPTQPVPAIRLHRSGAARRLDLLHWGLIPHWARDPAIGTRCINARAETVREKPTYRAAFRHRRCLLLADGFFEWQKVPGGKKRPHLIRMADGEPFVFAGLWEQWQDEHGNEIESAAIITTEANAMIARIHNRMPVILDANDYDAWLDPKHPTPTDLQALLRPCPAELMEHHPVGTHVNSPIHDDARCIEPVPGF